MSRQITERQQEVLNFIEEYINNNNRPPTISDIKLNFGFKSPQSVVDHLNALEKKLYIKRLPNSRGIVLLNKRNHFPILGKVAAGLPLASEELYDGNFTLSDYYEPEQTFVLKVTGDSMIGAGIYDGDMVLIKPKASAETGDIVVAVLNREYTIKKLVKKQNKIILKPENPSYEPIVITKDIEDFRIIGKVVGVHRILK